MHKKRKIAFRHGFGFSNNFWKNFMPFFKEYNCQLIEENYFDNESKILPNYDEIEVGMGHSLGFWKLCQELPKAKFLIGINAFTNFLGINHDLRVARSLEYKIFIDDFYDSPENCLKKFYRRCGLKDYGADFSCLNFDVLKEDLTLLEKSFSLAAGPKILIINSMDDLIVPRDLTEDNFANGKVRLHYFEKGKHALGYYYAEEISKMIKDFII